MSINTIQTVDKRNLRRLRAHLTLSQPNGFYNFFEILCMAV